MLFPSCHSPQRYPPRRDGSFFSNSELELGSKHDGSAHGQSVPLYLHDIKAGVGVHCRWVTKETEDALLFRMDMPGLGKEDVKIFVEQNNLTIKGEGAKEGEEEDSARRYSSRIDLPDKLYKIVQIKDEMKNGVPKVIMSKM
ncbi:Heat shock 22 kDa protein [Spatholobus suberectus]|nr:Heat shock 22 kDa protein [Spatholobus suberectus]